MVDQAALFALFLWCFGLGLLLDHRSSGDGHVGLVVGLLAGIFVPVVVLFVEAGTARSRGATIGLWVCGLRFDLGRRRGGYLEALEYFFLFWYETVLIPFARSEGSGVVRQPGAGFVRVVVALLVVASPVPFLLALG